MNSSADQKAPPRQATFLIVHGLSEYGTRYEEMAAYLRSAGFGVANWDLPGHGDRRHERPAIRSWFDTVLKEIEEHIEALRAQEQEVLLFGHSMGGTMVLKRLQQRGFDKLLSAAVVAPFLAPSGLAQKALFKSTSLLAKGFPKASIPGNNLAGNLTTDPEKQKAYRRDPMILNRIPFDLFAELHQSGADVANHRFPDLSSVYFAYGEKDPVCSPDAFRRFLQTNQIADDQIHTWPDARHELANERIREDFFESLGEWGRVVTSSRRKYEPFRPQSSSSI